MILSKLAITPRTNFRKPSPTYWNSSSTAVAPTIATVTVGLYNDSIDAFRPRFIPHVPAGSTIRFEFHAENHTLTESSTTAPCQKLASSDVDTLVHNANLQDLPPYSTYDLKIKDENPCVFYCRQTLGGSYCGEGMVFGVNLDEKEFSKVLRNATSTGR